MNIMNTLKKKIAKAVAKKTPETKVAPKNYYTTDPVVPEEARSRGSMTLSYRGDRGWSVPVDMDESPLNGDRMVMLADNGEVGSYMFDNGRWVPA